jgi:transcriptional regulator with XRE-family HTH domain
MSTRVTKKSKAVKDLEKIAGQELTFASMLLSTRLGMELTQEQFGKLLGVKRAYICDLEKGRTDVSIEQAIHFAKKLGRSKMLFVQLVIQEQCKQNGLNLEVKLIELAS